MSKGKMLPETLKVILWKIWGRSLNPPYFTKKIKPEGPKICFTLNHFLGPALGASLAKKPDALLVKSVVDIIQCSKQEVPD